MEMQKLKTVTIWTFDSSKSRLEVSVPVCDGHFKAKRVFEAALAALGLKKQSADYFTLTERLDSPKRRFIADDQIPENIKELSFQKWVFTSKQEKEIMKYDDMAGHLIFMQAEHLFESDRLKASKEEEDQLHEYSHPDFVLENQYTELCQRLPGYYQYVFQKCTVTDSCTTVNGVQFDQGSFAQLEISSSGLVVHYGVNILQFPWTSVQSWQLLPDQEVIKYSLEADDGLCTISLQTDRVLYLLAITKEMINLLQASDPKSPRFYSHMISTQEDGSTIWQNALFKYRKK